MRRTRLLAGVAILALAAALPAAAQQPGTAAQPAPAPAAGGPAAGSCVACHSDAARVPDAAARDPVARFKDDIHAARGLSCHDCHGGRPDSGLDGPDAVARAHDPATGWTPRPGPAQVPEFCGRCHSDASYMARFNPDARIDQLPRYLTSVHGERLVAGDTKVAECLSCHGTHPEGQMANALAHSIRAVSDPNNPVHPLKVAETCARCHANADYMAPYGIPTDQYEEYKGSVHHQVMVEKEDLSAPTCNDCHGNHGARPPNVDSMAFVCGTCHGRQADLFRTSKMKPAFDELGVGECNVCHSNHRVVRPDDSLLFHQPLEGDAPATGCYMCHPDADDPALAISTGIHEHLGRLAGRIAEAKLVLADAAAKGMPVSQAEFELTGANDALIEARALVHRFELDPVAEATGRGLKVADASKAEGESAISDFYFRHRWLGLSLFGIGFVIVSLWLKLRQVDRRWKAPQGG